MNPLDLVFDFLRGDSVWLLVLDNADDTDVLYDQSLTTTFQYPESQQSTKPLAMYILQTSRRGSVLITSRNRDAAFRLTGHVENLINVPYMSKEDSTALLGIKLPKKDDPLLGIKKDESSDDEKLELVELLEYLPLAITQAASYIGMRSTRMTVARYCDLLRQSDRLLHENVGDARRDPTIPSSVFLTWQISFDQIKKENRPAADLLSIMSVFDRQGIPKFLIQDMDEDNFDFERRLDPLADFSLITVTESGQSFQMHRLVQMAIVSWLERQGDIDRWKDMAAVLLERSLPDNGYESWKIWEILLPHVEIALKYHFPNPESQLLHARVLVKTADYFEERGRYDAATEKCQRALNIQVEMLGEDDTETLDCLLLLARLKRLGVRSGISDTDEAEVLSRRALSILERGQENDGDRWLNAQSNLALALLESHDDRRIEEATDLLRSVLASREQSLGLEHIITLTGMNNLAGALHCQKRYTEAGQLHRQVLETQMRILGDDHPATMTTSSNLASLLNEQRKYEEAQELAQRALDMGVTVLGEEHPDTLNSMVFLFNAFFGQKKYVEAEELGRYALSVHKTVFGDIHYKTVHLSDRLVSSVASGAVPHPAPTGLSKSALELFTVVNFLENLEAAFFEEGLNNITQHWSSQDQHREAFAVVQAVQAQEVTHVDTAKAILTANNAPTLAPCKYTFPVEALDPFIALAQDITSVGLSYVIFVTDMLAASAVEADRAAVGGPSSIAPVEARHDAYFRIRSHSGLKLPNPAPFDTAISANAALNLASQFVVPGSCPQQIPAFTAFPSMTVAGKASPPLSGSISFQIGDAKPLSQYSSGHLFIVWVNQAFDLLFQPVTAIDKQKSMVTSTIPEGLAGVAYAALTNSTTATTVGQLNDETVAGPAIVQIS